MSKLMRVVIIGLILFSAITVYFSFPKEDMYATGADEGYYFLYAKIIAQNGIGAFPALLREYLDTKQAQLFPHPARIGHILMTAFWFKAFPNTYFSLANFSFLCFVLLIMLSFYFCRKFFGKDPAYFYTLLLSCSPILMHSGKRCLQDSSVNLFWALSVWLFLDFLIKKQKYKFILFLISFYLSILIKESSVILMAFFAAAYLLYRFGYKQQVRWSYFAGLVVIPVLAAGLTFMVLLGTDNFIGLIKFISGVHFPGVITNSYSLYNTGPWFKFIIDFLLLSPITALLFIGYTLHILFLRKIEWKQAYFLMFFVIIFAISSSMKYTKIVRFVSILEISICLFSVLALYELFRQKDLRYQIYCVVSSIGLIYFINYNTFIFLFLHNNIYDPVSNFLLYFKNVVPCICPY